MLDSGTGPGVCARMMIENGFEKVIGLDPSILLLRSAKEHLGDHFHPVRAVAEHQPFRNAGVDAVITCFSLRDVRDTAMSLREFARVTRKEGRLEIVDIGKPDSPPIRRLVSLYVTVVMPLVARFFIGRRERVNPFRMIIPTFHRLSTNRELERLAGREFGFSSLREVLLGGLIVIEASHRELI